MHLLQRSAHQQKVVSPVAALLQGLGPAAPVLGKLGPWTRRWSVELLWGVGQQDRQTRWCAREPVEPPPRAGFRLKPDDQPPGDGFDRTEPAVPSRSEAYFRALFEQAPEAILVSDAEGRCLDASAAATELFGWTREALRGLGHLAQLAADPAWMRVEFARLQEAGVWQGEATLRRRDGSLLAVEVRARRVAPQTRQPVYVLSCRSVAARPRSEQQALLAMTAHELRNPAAAIRSYAQLLRAQPALTTRAVERIIALTSRLERLADDLLGLTSADPAAARLRLADTDLVELARTSVAQAQALRTQGRVRLEAPPGPVRGRWDRQRLEQTLENLLSNALKYVPTGEIVVRIVDLGTQAQVSVADHGAGISPEVLPTIFEPFTRAPDGPSRGVAGTGLGLAIARAAVEAHRGRLWVESVPGQGSTFGFTLPYDPGQGQPEPSVRLSGRELEVARLIAQGRSNREIAQALVLTPGTVANHVRRILEKGGFSNRSEVAAWVAARGLVPATPGRQPVQLAANPAPPSGQP